MDFKQLRNEVQSLRDELAIMKRKYEDIIYNLDTENFSSRFVKEQGDMRTAIEVNAKGLGAKVSNKEFQSELSLTAQNFETRIFALDNSLSTKIAQNEDKIETEVKALSDTDDMLYSQIVETSTEISLIVGGEYTENMLENYLTGIEIKPHQIKMKDDSVYSIYNSDGLRFYDSANQVEGWSIEPDADYGGVLKYYVNGQTAFSFGTGMSGDGYSGTDLCLKSINQNRDRFVVDLTDGGSKEVKFVGLFDYSGSKNEPRIYANGLLLATQNWVENNVVAVFG
jgi:hypothetical protein